MTHRGNPFSVGNVPSGYVEGIATRSKHRIKAVAHLLVSCGDGSYRTWCTAAPAMAETPLGDPCRKCVALLRERREEYGDELLKEGE